MKTHKAITHPALRNRMAQALYQLRNEYPLMPWGDSVYSDSINDRFLECRLAARMTAALMAALEEALDTAQEARIFGHTERN